MEIIEFPQGSKEWHEARLKSFTASEAPAMMGASKYMSRTELLKLKKTGIQSEVSPHTQMIFDKGHKTEALARPIIEIKFMEEFYPITGVIEVDGLRILASFDGLTMMEDTVFEHKLWNKELAEQVSAGGLHNHYCWQLEQQLLVSGAERAIFVVSDGTEENMVFYEYYPVQGRKEELIAGWKQFAIDLESFECQKEEVKPEGIVNSLPALSFKVTGSLITSNISECIDAISHRAKTEMDLIPSTDQEFADKEALIKAVKETRSNLKLRTSSAENEFISFSEFASACREMDKILQKLQSHSEKLVKIQKEQIKLDIINKADNDMEAHYLALNDSLSGLNMPSISVDFSGATKGKRNPSSMRDAVETELARIKIEVNAIADIIRANIGYLNRVAREYKFLFNDLQEICNKDAQSFTAIVSQRIDQHIESEKIKEELQRERIRKEEQLKAQREAEEKLELERKAIRDEEEARRIEFEKSERQKLEREGQRIKEEEQKKYKAKVEERKIAVRAEDQVKPHESEIRDVEAKITEASKSIKSDLEKNCIQEQQKAEGEVSGIDKGKEEYDLLIVSFLASQIEKNDIYDFGFLLISNDKNLEEEATFKLKEKWNKFFCENHAA